MEPSLPLPLPLGRLGVGARAGAPAEDKRRQRHPFKIDLIINLILDNIPRPLDLISCRAVNRRLFAEVTPRLESQNVRLALSSRMVRGYYQAVVQGGRGWTLPQALDLNIYLAGQKTENDEAASYAERMITDPGVVPPRVGRAIRVGFGDLGSVDEVTFWNFVQSAAPELEELSMNPDNLIGSTPDKSGSSLPTVIPFPCLTRLALDIGQRQPPHVSGNQLISFLTNRSREIVANAPNLEALSLIRIDPGKGEPIYGDYTPCTTAFISRLEGLTTQISELELCIYRPEEQSIQSGLPSYLELITALNQSLPAFSHLRCLKFHQHIGYALFPRFVNFLAEIPTLTSLEYYFMKLDSAPYFRGLELHPNDDEVAQAAIGLGHWMRQPQRELPNITHFGFYFLASGAGLTSGEHQRQQLEFERLLQVTSGSCMASMLQPLSSESQNSTFLSNITRFLAFLTEVSRTCPNLESLSADLYACMAVAPLYAFGGGVLIATMDESGAVRSLGGQRFHFQNVDSIKVDVPVFTHVGEPLSTNLATRLTQIWSTTGICPILNKLFLDFTAWSPCTSHERLRIPPGVLSAWLNVTGIRELELHNYWDDWLSELLLEDKKSVPVLRANLWSLDIRSPVTKFRNKCNCARALASSSTPGTRKQGIGDLHKLIDCFDQLRDISVELGACKGIGPTEALVAKYKNTNIHFI